MIRSLGATSSIPQTLEHAPQRGPTRGGEAAPNEWNIPMRCPHCDRYCDGNCAMAALEQAREAQQEHDRRNPVQLELPNG